MGKTHTHTLAPFHGIICRFFVFLFYFGLSFFVVLLGGEATTITAQRWLLRDTLYPFCRKISFLCGESEALRQLKEFKAFTNKARNTGGCFGMDLAYLWPLSRLLQ